jgi:hypothetical protein
MDHKRNDSINEDPLGANHANLRLFKDFQLLEQKYHEQLNANEELKKMILMF